MLQLAVLLAQAARHAIEVIPELGQLVAGPYANLDIEVTGTELTGRRRECLERPQITAKLRDCEPGRKGHRAEQHHRYGETQSRKTCDGVRGRLANEDTYGRRGKIALQKEIPGASSPIPILTVPERC